MQKVKRQQVLQNQLDYCDSLLMDATLEFNSKVMDINKTRLNIKVQLELLKAASKKGRVNK